MYTIRAVSCLDFAKDLISETIEYASVEHGSPPFPDLEELEEIRDKLEKYIENNRQKIDDLIEAKGE